MSYGGETSSGQLTGAATILAMPGTLCSIDILPGASADFTVTVYDSNNATLTGKTILGQAQVAAGAGSMHHDNWYVPANQGLRAEVAGTAGSYVVRFKIG